MLQGGGFFFNSPPAPPYEAGRGATRMASATLIFTMAVAVFIVHADDPFARKELGLIYMLVYIVLLITGSGKYSIDRLIRK